MTEHRMKCALTGLQWTLGLVILIEAVLFLMPSARHDFARTHMPDILRQVPGWGEILGAILLLIPRTAVRGAWVLAGIVFLAIIAPLLHRMFKAVKLGVDTPPPCTPTLRHRKQHGRGYHRHA